MKGESKGLPMGKKEIAQVLHKVIGKGGSSNFLECGQSSPRLLQQSGAESPHSKKRPVLLVLEVVLGRS
jgi:hypothetical protein